MAAARTLLLFTLTGALLGVAVASYIAPGLLTWYNTPSQGQAMCPCAETARDTANRLIQSQTIGGSIGAAAFFVLGILWVRSRKKNAVAPPAAPPAPPAPAPMGKTNTPPAPAP